jgi:hypothetical protein
MTEEHANSRRIGITPDPARLSTTTAKDIAIRQAWHELT